MSYNKTLQSNNTDLQAILNTINALPEAGGTTLPVLTNPANASELLNGKELIDGEGNVITGSMPNNGAITMTMDGIDTKTMSIPEGYTSGGTISLDGTIDAEVSEQTDLIAQIKTAANNLPEAGSSNPNLQDKTVTPTTTTQTITADSGYDGLASVVVEGDANLVSENIVSGISIFGVAGTAEIGTGSGGSSDSAETITIVNNTGKLLTCGASQIASGGSAQLPFTKSGNATQIPIIVANDLGSMTATSTSGTVTAVFYDYVKLYINGTTTGTNLFCAMVYCINITSGSTITISV